MIKSSPFFRTRRRRASLTLFAGPLQRTAVEPLADRRWIAHEGASEVRFGAARDDDDPHEADIRDVVARLQREVRADRRLRHVDEEECARLVDESVRTLWASSRVKAFVPLFAMQRVRERLGMGDEKDDGDA